MNIDPRLLETEQRVQTENSESSPFKKASLIKRQNTDQNQNVILRQLHNLQYIDQIPKGDERRVIKTKKRQQYISTFITNLRHKSRNFQTLHQTHYEMIGDNTAFDTKLNNWPRRTLDKLICFQTVDRVCERTMKVFQFLLSKLPIIYPATRFKIIWDIIAIVARLYFLYLIPLDLAWGNYNFMFDMYLNTTQIMIFLLVVDVIIGFNTAYYQYGQVVNSRIKIIKHRLYRCYGLEWISILILLVYTVISMQSNIEINITKNFVHLIMLVFLVHQSTNYDVLKYYEEGLDISKKASSILQLCKFITFLFYILHIFSCFWFWVGAYSQSSINQSWIAGDLEIQYWNVQYLEALYFASVTMFTVGYGDVTPVSNLEKIVSILFIIVASIQLPYSINTVGRVIREISAYGDEKKRKIRLINSYMQKRKVSFNLQLQIRQYLNYYWQQQKQQDLEDQKEIISELSETLKEKLMIEAYSVMLNECPLFKNRYSQQFKSLLLNKIKSIVVPPGTYVEAPDNLTLCFIDDGEIEISLDAGRVIQLGKLQKGSTLGLSSFIVGQKHPERYKSIGFTKLLLLTREDFLKTISDFPQDYELFCQIKDHLIFNPDQSLVPMECFSCKSKLHKLIQCDLLHYVADKEAILKRNTFNKEQMRQQFKRKKIEKETTEFNNLLSRSAIQKIQKENPQFVKAYENMIYTVDRAKVLKKQRSIQLLYERHLDKSDNINIISPQIKFKQAVRKVIIINTLRNKKSNINKDQSNKKLLNRLFERYKGFFQFKKEKEQIEFLIHKVNQQSLIDDEHFETPKNFINYKKKNNISALLTSSLKLKIGLINKFLPFFLYPSEVIKRFGCKSQVRNIVNYKRRKNVILF